MDFQALLVVIGSMPLFVSRAFLPAFLVSLLLRFGDRIPLLANAPVLQDIGGVPTWFTHDATILVLGILATLEIVGMKMKEADELVDKISINLKAAMPVLTGLGILNAADASVVEEIMPPAVQGAGIVGVVVLPFVGFTVFWLAGIRSQVLELLVDMDDDDDLGMRSLLSWAEDSWVLVGAFLLVIYPLIMALLLLGVIAILFLIRRYMDHREEKSKIQCEACEASVYACALQCPSCQTEISQPRAIGFFGQSRDDAITDRAKHELDLVEKRRCPVCATRFTKRHPRQLCQSCGHDLFANAEFQDRYTQRIAERLPLVLCITTGLSLIPIIGIIPGILYYRFKLVAPFSRYMPVGGRFCLKWLLRLLLLILISIQIIPAVGIWVIPVMAILSYWLYRGGFKSLLDAPSTPNSPPEREL